eukprot:TRINITY_DN7651_c0_g1_i1.p1 TRINITY_DN7651_c0_g1~~TRINITY_DN7651_c0_g1_i1.p1  ORF type:complete len:464 (-),score=101.32 TRINITY_DN7651_c0_g1_i1:24-1415(-)
MRLEQTQMRAQLQMRQDPQLRPSSSLEPPRLLSSARDSTPSLIARSSPSQSNLLEERRVALPVRRVVHEALAVPTAVKASPQTYSSIRSAAIAGAASTPAFAEKAGSLTQAVPPAAGGDFDADAGAIRQKRQAHPMAELPSDAHADAARQTFQARSTAEQVVRGRPDAAACSCGREEKLGVSAKIAGSRSDASATAEGASATSLPVAPAAAADESALAAAGPELKHVLQRRRLLSECRTAYDFALHPEESVAAAVTSQSKVEEPFDEFDTIERPHVRGRASAAAAEASSSSAGPACAAAAAAAAVAAKLVSVRSSPPPVAADIGEDAPSRRKHAVPLQQRSAEKFGVTAVLERSSTPAWVVGLGSRKGCGEGSPSSGAEDLGSKSGRSSRTDDAAWAAKWDRMQEDLDRTFGESVEELSLLGPRLRRHSDKPRPSDASAQPGLSIAAAAGAESAGVAAFWTTA